MLRGHDGFSFGDIVAAVGTTRANVHHHFGNKRRLMAELLKEFATDAEARIARHWTRPGLSFVERMAAQSADLRQFYDRFNPASPRAAAARNVWSPVSRIRLDLPVLGDLATAALDQVNRAYDASLRHALAEAVAAGEFRPDTPIDEVAHLLRVTFLSCGPITQDTGDFTDVERLLAFLARTLRAAWGAAAPATPTA